MAEITYPTEWQLGKPRGSIKTNPTNYQVTLSPPNVKQIVNFFRFCEYKNQIEALKAAETWQMQKSDEYDLTRNKIRYLDKDTIEVQLTQDQVMKTDAKFIKEVQKYPLNAKSKLCKKEGKEYIKYYALCQDVKKTFPFNSLITNYKIVEYKNGDSLDNRLCNMKEFGGIDKALIEETVKISDNKKNNADDIIKDSELQPKYFYVDIKDLPKNIWILGKPSGTIFKAKDEPNIIHCRINDNNNKIHSKTFNIKDYKSEKEAMNEAKKWQIKISYQLGVTKNMIKLIDNNLILVQIACQDKTKEIKTMKTNKILINLIQKISIFESTNPRGISYPCSVINDKIIAFHILITKYKEYNESIIKIDHINGDKFDNTFENLRPVNTSLNNINRINTTNKSYYVTANKKNPKIELDASVNNDNYFFSFPILLNDKDMENPDKLNNYCSDFSFNFRQKIIKISQIDKDTIQDIINDCENSTERYDLTLLKYTSALLDIASNIANKSICYDYNIYKEYLCDILDDKEVRKIFKFYINHQIEYHHKLLKLSIKSNKLYKTKLMNDIVEKLKNDIINMDISKKEPTKIKNILKIMNTSTK